MLLEFRVRNFRSLGAESVLSLVASKDLSLQATNTVETGLSAAKRVLRSAVIYGANASGKTNVIRALHLMRGMVVDSAAFQPKAQFAVQPFRLDTASSAAPTMFETTILLNGVRYQYGFEFTASRIEAEWLYVYRTAKPQTWFERRANPDSGKDSYEFSTHLTGSKRTWQEATRANALFLSVAVQLNSDLLAPLHHWFAETLQIMPNGIQAELEHTAALLANPDDHARVVSLLGAADIAISAVTAQPAKMHEISVKHDLTTGLFDHKAEERQILLPRFRHTVGDVSVEFDFGDESQGTLKLFSVAATLFDILKRGLVLIIDELDSSFHPLLVRRIIETFHDPSINCNGAQLIFTTHDTSQLDQTLFRRDQIWFTEKDVGQCTRLIPLTDFSARKGEALERGYLSGRYGGVPILSHQLVSGGDCG